MARKFEPLTSGIDGDILANVGRYHRNVVSIVFEMNGGIDWMADWARRNPDLFFTRIYPRLIPKEVEVSNTESVDSLLRKLNEERDRDMVNITPTAKDQTHAERSRTQGIGFAEAAADSEDR